jgi:hypothetical protein
MSGGEMSGGDQVETFAPEQTVEGTMLRPAFPRPLGTKSPSARACLAHIRGPREARLLPRVTAPGQLAALLLAALLLAVPLEVRAESDEIEGVTVALEESNTVTFDVAYTYSGDRGDNVFLSVVMAQDGKTSAYYGFRPGQVERGHHRTRVQLGISDSAPPLYSTNQIKVAMYVGGQRPFLERSFLFAKTWSSPGAELQAVPQVLGIVTPLPGTLTQIKPLGEAPTAGAGAGVGDSAPRAPVRRILPNGHTELRYPDGTIRERFAGGETVTRPGGVSQTFLYSSAQPPTPPSAPPDADLALWLEDENRQLLEIIRLLVANDEASVQNYLSQEGDGLSAYGRIVLRTETVDRLVRP